MYCFMFDHLHHFSFNDTTFNTDLFYNHGITYDMLVSMRFECALCIVGQ